MEPAQGVLNGIDTALWDPATDPLIPAPFTPERLEGKALCKRFAPENLPILAFTTSTFSISALSQQYKRLEYKMFFSKASPSVWSENQEETDLGSLVILSISEVHTCSLEVTFHACRADLVLWVLQVSSEGLGTG